MAGGGGKQRPTNNNKSKDASGNSRRRRSNGASGRIRNSLFVEGGVLSDWAPSSSFPGGSSNSNSKSGSKAKAVSASTNGPRKSNRNAFGYNYPSVKFQEGLLKELSIEGFSQDDNLDQSRPIILVESKETPIVAYLDGTPPKTPYADLTYDYNSSFVLGDSSHSGLGFHDDSQTTPVAFCSSSKHVEGETQEGKYFDSSLSDKEMDAETINYRIGEEMDEGLTEMFSPKKNSGLLSIGGMKLYTQDVSDEESDGEVKYDEVSESSELQELSEFSESDVSTDVSDSGSDIDEEVAEDYLEGIGGSDNILDAKFLVENHIDESDEDSASSGDCFDEALEKLGGFALQDASVEYGMKKLRPRNKNTVGVADAWPSALYDLMLIKDPRTASSRKKHISRLPQSWPAGAQRSKTFRKFPGEKKKHRKEMIAQRRAQRALRRGVDLQKIIMKLEQIVLDEVDMFAFQPMHSRDCSQVKRLAAIYRLRSGYQGSGKKRFVTVERTQHTSMPSASDKLRLEKLIGAGNEEDDFAVTEGSRSKPANTSRNRTNSSRNLPDGQNIGASRRRGGRKTLYSNQPVSFVSSGIMSETVHTMTKDSEEAETSENKVTFSSGKVGAFELHTKGFGSKMMAKMGYVEGGGLGKDGKGMQEPIEVIKRPKSLGLGANIPSTSGDSMEDKPQIVERFQKHAKTRNLGAFERHTKGFGSKMMAKMGFVEGSGLGKHSQGIVNPLVAVRLPKSRGLGAKG